MEALVFILAELLIAPAVIFGGLILNIAAGVLIVVLEVVAAILGLQWSFLKAWRQKRAAKAKAAQSGAALPTKPASTARRKTWRVFEIASLSVLLVFICMTLLIELVLFEPAAKFALRQISERTPYTVTAENIDGSLFGADIRAQGVDVRTKPDSDLKLDFRVDTLAVDGHVWSLVSPLQTPAVDMQIAGVTGAVVAPPKTGKSASDGERKPRKDFTISTLAMSDVAIGIALSGREPVELEIAHLQSEPLRSRSALFDLFFRSNMTAKIDGSPITITMEQTESGRRTRWDANALPLAILSKLTDRAPLAWLSEGTAQLNVRDEWSRGERDDIDLDWNITLDNARFTVPSDTSLVQRTLAMPIVSYVNNRDGPVDFAFSMTLDENGLQYANSLDSLGLWDALIGSISSQIGQSLGLEADGVESGVDTLIDRTRNFLDRRAREQGNN